MTTRIYIYPMMITGTMVQYTTRQGDMTTVKIAKPEEFESLVHVDNGKFMAIVANGFESKHQAQAQPMLTGAPTPPTPIAKNASSGAMLFKGDVTDRPIPYSKEADRLLTEIAALRIELELEMEPAKINSFIANGLKTKLDVLGRTEFDVVEHELQERVALLKTLRHYVKGGKEVSAADTQTMMKTAQVRTDGVDFNTLNQPSEHPLYGIDAGKAS